MEIREEQRRRAEANRLAALEKRQRLEGAAPSYEEWKLVKCQATSVPPTKYGRFDIVLEICAPDEFSVSPKPATGFPFPGEAESVREINACLSSVSSFPSFGSSLLFRFSRGMAAT